MNRSVFLAAAMLLSAGASAADALAAKPQQSGKSSKSCQQATAFEKDVGYCTAVRIGNTLYISGAAAPGPMPDAIKRVYGSLTRTLAAHGLNLGHVVKETVYATDLDALIKHQAVRKALYADSFPASTWVQVSRLYEPSLVLEVEVIAVFP